MELRLKYILFCLSLIASHGLSRLLGTSTKQIESAINIPEGLLFGAGTSAFQVEGALKTNGRTESFIDNYYFSITQQTLPDLPDISSDSYHKYKKDVEVLKYIGLHFYRFSISWSRLLPTGYANHVNQEGLDYYHALLHQLEKAGIEPIVQLVHYDHPVVFEKFGGWQNESMVELFKDYAKIVFQNFGHRVKYFLTFNEPNVFCNFLDSGIFSKEQETKLKFPRVFLCAHNILKAHAEAYHLYHNEFNSNKTGMISINFSCLDSIAKDENDQESADVAFAFGCGWFANPIFSKSGDYSDILKRRVAESNRLQGENQQLPRFSDAWVEKIRGTADFFSLSYYSARLVEPAPTNDTKSWPNVFVPPEARLILSHNDTWTRTLNQNYIVPQGLRRVLKTIKEQYNNPPTYIVENGYADNGQLNDTDRIEFIYAHVKEVINAINYDQCNVKSYIYWSLIDNFEIWDGYSSHFGLAHIDFNDPNRPRTLKRSATWMRDILRQRQMFLQEE